MPDGAKSMPIGIVEAGALGLTERWYVVQSRPHQEFYAAGHLAEQRFRSYVPRLAKTVRHARRTKTVLAPLFPRYLFVTLDLERDAWRSVLGTLGVTSLIMDNGRPKPVQPGVVEAIAAATAPDGSVSFAHGIEIGAQVRLLSGPLAEQVGRVARLDDKGRVAVLLELMGAERLVTAPASAVLPVGG